MTIDLNRMRRCFLVAAVWNGWTEADQAEFGAAIKAAVDAGDTEALAWWADFLEQASGLAYLTALCRATEARIKAAAEERRRKAG